MAGDNLARLAKETQEEERAYNAAKEIIDRFLKAANQLRNWPHVTWSGRDANGTLFGPLPRERDVNTIIMEQTPALEEIHQAVKKWDSTRAVVQGIYDNLTHEEKALAKSPVRR